MHQSGPGDDPRDARVEPRRTADAPVAAAGARVIPPLTPILLRPVTTALAAGDLGEAERLIAGVLETHPYSPLVWRQELILQQRRGDEGSAAASLVACLSEAPEKARPNLLHLALSFADPDVIAEAVTAAGLDVHAWARRAIVRAALDKGDGATAEALLDRDRAAGAGDEPEHQILAATLDAAAGKVRAAKVRLNDLIKGGAAGFPLIFDAFDLALKLEATALVDLALRYIRRAKGKHRLRAARCLVAAERHEDAWVILAALLPDKALGNTAAYWLGHYLRYAGRLAESEAVMLTLVQRDPTHAKALFDLAELCLEDGRDDEVHAYAARARSQVMDEAETFCGAQALAHMAAGDLATGWAAYRNRGVQRQLRYGRLPAYTRELDAWLDKTPRLLCAVSGLGDEIRWASLYRDIPDEGVTITCDPRLAPLLRRSFPTKAFLPVRRRYKVLDPLTSAAYDRVPHPELSYIFDNAGWAEATAAASVTTTADIVGALRGSRDGFTHDGPLLAADAARTEEIRAGLVGPQPVIGLIWRSELKSYARTQHFIPFPVVKALLAGTDARWMVLQGDATAEELTALEAAAPGRLAPVPAGLDIRQDLDGLAALLCALEAVVAPAVSTVELAAALGRPTVLVSRSRQVLWRIQPDGRDLWFAAARHAHSPIADDFTADSLLDEILAALALLGLEGGPS